MSTDASRAGTGDGSDSYFDDDGDDDDGGKDDDEDDNDSKADDYDGGDGDNELTLPNAQGIHNDVLATSISAL